MNKPNIIFIFSDQQRHDTCGCYGQELNITPNLDKMAEEGVLFTNVFTCQPLCTPARGCIHTGLYATQTGVVRNGIGLPISQNNIANYMSENGYETSYAGKWHLATNMLGTKNQIGESYDYSTTPVPPKYRGGYKDYWFAADTLEFTSKSYEGYLFNDMNKIEFKDRYRVDIITDNVLKYLESREKSKPLFLFLSFLEPHHQNNSGHFEGPIGSKEKFKNFKVPGDLVGTEGDWQEEYPDYLGCCHNIDSNVKRIQDKLGELGMSENTILIYTSDHGCHFKTRNSEYKRSCHDASIHIPLIINGPGFQGGKEISELVSIIDFAPTILRSADIEIPEHMMGRPIQDLVEGTAINWPQEVFVQISESQVGRAIRTKKWKYSVRAPKKSGYGRSQSRKYEEDYLYDLEKDVHERDNLVNHPDYLEVREKLSEVLKKKMVEAEEKIPIIIRKR
jgi:uncharacterized sulfatase